MASDGPDPQNLKLWQDAFQYPIPTVRRVEQELRRDVSSNKEKLRALVGTRYRELVGTAETIVTMNREMQVVDSKLADVGRRCNPRLMGRQYAHFKQVNGTTDDQDATKQTLGAQLALLHRLSVLISRFLRKRSSLLLIAKLFVISRRLHNTLSKQKSAPPFLESLRNQLALLGQTLCNQIDKRLASTKSTANDIIEALAAYCLAKRSSSDDAIAYFHKARLEVIGNQLGLSDPSGENVLAALRLYIRTLQVSKTLLSRRFSDSLSKLKAQPLLSDPDISGLDVLDLDVLGRWVPADVTNFTPWIKLSELSKQDAEKTMKKWSKTAFNNFVDHCQSNLRNWTDFSELLSLRKKTLELWLCSCSSTPTHSDLQVLEGIRNVFNERLADILSNNAKALDDFGNGVSTAITSWDGHTHDSSQSLWDDELVNLDYSNGAATFKLSIADRLLGLDGDTSNSLEKYRTWLLSIKNDKEAIDGLRADRWPDTIDEAADENPDLEFSAILNEDDPQFLWEALSSAVRQAFDSLQTSFSATFKELSDSSKSSKAAFILKLVRLVRKELPREFISDDLQFSQDIVPKLQEMLANEVMARTPPLSFAALLSSGSQRLPGRTLWEGEPELPVQPSPSTFKFLRRVVGSMDHYGTGLWDISTVHALKSILQEELSQIINSKLDQLDSPEAGKDESISDSVSDITSPAQNGNRSPSAAQGIQERILQLYFDIAFLTYAFTGRDLKSQPLTSIAEQFSAILGSSAEQTTTIDRRAQEHWQRTRLLFGLLAIDGPL